MKISSRHEEHHEEVHTGPKEDMLKFRKEKFNDNRKQVEKVLKDWTGSPLVLVTTVETDDGKGCQAQVLCLGVGNGYEQAAMLKALAEASQHMEKVNSKASGDPFDSLLEMLRQASKSEK